jgi:hypothetical protein
MSSRRIYVQGTGAICSLGVGRAPFLDAIFRGDSGIRPLERLRGEPGVAGEVPADWADAERLSRAVLDEAGSADAMIRNDQSGSGWRGGRRRR